VKKSATEDSWLTPKAMDLLDPTLQEGVIAILEDMAWWPHLKYAYVIGKDGLKLTYSIGQMGELVSEESYRPSLFYNLATTVEEYLANIDHPAPAHVTVELAGELLFVASTGELFLVASFESDVERGYMSMKLAKRIAHLCTLHRMRRKGL